MIKIPTDRRTGKYGLLKCAALVLALVMFAGCPSTDALYRRAYTHYVWKEEEQALKILESILEKNPAYTPASLLASVIRQARGEDDKALALLKIAKQNAPRSAVVCYNLGNIYFKKGEYESAVREYSEALAVDSGLSEAYLNRANARMALKRYPAALTDYEVFLKLTVKDHPDVKKLVELLRVEFPPDKK